ncbi:Endo-1-3(4)-beta-glucanase [Penicillium taxi]|uniref:Endo-1-3(4)-beta-glucanase n=1 Tax=Penicillium taxi TaxID=168475 RepID=UPI0025457C90|nr:Endo-1-3(4)-beta-glucanase [Penicillium taxi]KAJ5893685.1 Endo-1-3(4)-beta-glucanase [Penicillium taxi]
MKPYGLSLGILGLLVTCFTTAYSSPTPLDGESYPLSRSNLSECDCFIVSGEDPGYFQQYKLWDFRSVPFNAHVGLPPDADDEDKDDEDKDEFTDEDDGIDDDGQEDDQGNVDNSTQDHPLYLFQTPFHKDWSSQEWSRSRNTMSPVNMVNSKKNLFFTRANGENSDATYLVMRATRHSDFTSAAEIETRVQNIFRCSLRVRMRILPVKMDVSEHPDLSKLNVKQEITSRFSNLTQKANTTLQDPERPSPGACVGIFTYGAKNCESDIEILSSDPTNRVRYANQPDYDPGTDQMIPGSSTVAELPVPWTSWATHRLDWQIDKSRWWVNNILQDTKTYQVPNLQSMLILNLWSDGGEWTGDMKIGDKIHLGIEYIELAYNQSSDGSVILPPDEGHGGHQRPQDHLSARDDHLRHDLFEEATGIMTGVVKKRCRKGKRGRRCRKNDKDSDRKGGNGRNDWEKNKNGAEPKICRRVCNVDDHHFADA